MVGTLNPLKSLGINGGDFGTLYYYKKSPTTTYYVREHPGKDEIVEFLTEFVVLVGSDLRLHLRIYTLKSSFIGQEDKSR